MTIWWLILILGFILSGGTAFIYLAINVKRSGAAVKTVEDFQAEAEKDVEHIFNQEFREELRNRGRLHFEKSSVRTLCSCSRICA